MSLGGAAAAAAQILPAAHFPIPEEIEANIDFWASIYSKYHSRQAVLHDEWDLSVVYGTIDLADLEQIESDATRSRLRRDRINDRKKEVEQRLRALAEQRNSKDPEDRRLLALWSHHGADRATLLAAASQVRAQIGLRDKFAEAIERCGLYLEGIERVFVGQGLPVALSRLPFVESMFVNVARSKVGAVGAWQFMPGTARIYLPMNSAVDGRMDVFMASQGAATMLRHDYEELRTWPLALTAYNHGRAGMKRAKATVGSDDLGDIISSYKSRTFGFASRNFYSEFIAAVRVFEDRARLFPEVEPASPLRFDEFTPTQYVSLDHLATAAELDAEHLRELNPALHNDVFVGSLLVPMSYPLRVPAGMAGRVAAAYDRLPQGAKANRQAEFGYKVRRGDTLGALARRFGTTTSAIVRANNLRRADRIYVGQRLSIPGQTAVGTVPAAAATAAAPRPSTAATTHRVRSGETLSAIASRYGRSIQQLARANGLASADQLAVGQRLQIPAAGAASQSREYVVRSGDNLNKIASLHGVSVGQLRSANSIRGSVIHPGQVLVIPTS